MAKTVTFVTGNLIKLRIAREACAPLGLTIEQAEADIPEIQSHDGAAVARHKVRQAYRLLRRPLVTGDDTWLIPGLNGFPGAYMKDVNEWFTIADWVHLTRPLQDRRIILQQHVNYQDATTEKAFLVEIAGTLLSESRGTHKYGHTAIMSVDGGKSSVAEAIGQTEGVVLNLPTAWHDFAAWYTAR